MIYTTQSGTEAGIANLSYIHPGGARQQFVRERSRQDQENMHEHAQAKDHGNRAQERAKARRHIVPILLDCVQALIDPHEPAER